MSGSLASPGNQQPCRKIMSLTSRSTSWTTREILVAAINIKTKANILLSSVVGVGIVMPNLKNVECLVQIHSSLRHSGVMTWNAFRITGPLWVESTEYQRIVFFSLNNFLNKISSCHCLRLIDAYVQSHCNKHGGIILSTNIQARTNKNSHKNKGIQICAILRDIW